MNEDSVQSSLARALGAYARSLRGVQPSAALDARIAGSIQKHVRVRTSRPLWLRPMPWLVAAASVAAMAAGVALLMRNAPPAAVQGVATPGTAQADRPRARSGDPVALPSSQYSLWPTEAAVFRVKASLGATPTSVPANGERQYWVDVRVANDGSMRIVRVIPANGDD